MLEDSLGLALTLVALALLAVGGYLLALRLLGEEARRDALALAIATLLAATAEALAIALLLGALGLLRREAALAAQAALVAALALAGRSARPGQAAGPSRNAPPGSPRPAGAAAELREPARRLARRTWEQLRGHPALSLLTLHAVGSEALRGLLRPPLSWDSLMYHLMLSATWLQRHDLAPVLGPYLVNYYGYVPANGSLWFWWWMAPSHSELYVNLASLPQWALAGLAVGGIARQLGARRHWPLASFLVLLTPVVVRFAATEYVDLFMSATLLAGCFFALRWIERPRLADAVLAGAGCGLAAGAKALGLPYAAALAAATVLLARTGAGGQGGPAGAGAAWRWLRARVPQLAAALLAAAALGSFFYLRNVALGADPLALVCEGREGKPAISAPKPAAGSPAKAAPAAPVPAPGEAPVPAQAPAAAQGQVTPAPAPGQPLPVPAPGQAPAAPAPEPAPAAPAPAPAPAPPVPGQGAPVPAAGQAAPRQAAPQTSSRPATPPPSAAPAPRPRLLPALPRPDSLADQWSTFGRRQLLDAFLGITRPQSVELGVGPQAFLLLLAFLALPFGVAAERRRAALLAASQIAFELLFWVLVPFGANLHIFANIRYLVPAIGLAFAGGVAVAEHRGMNERWLRGIALALACQSLLQLHAEMPRGVRVAIAVADLAAVGLGVSAGLRGLLRRRPGAFAAAGLALALLGAPLLARFRAADRKRALATEWTAHSSSAHLFAGGWGWLDAHGGNGAVAVVGSPATYFVYPAMGPFLQRRALYVNVNRANYPLAVRYPGCNPRVDPSPPAWLDNVAAAHVRWLLLNRYPEYGFPPEAAWARAHPERFARRYEDRTSLIFEVLPAPAAPANGR